MSTTTEPLNGSHPTTADTATARPSITAPALGVVGAGFALLTGAWLMYAPFVLGYQAAGAEWADATVTDFWTGLGLGVLALVSLGILTAGLVGALRAHGAIAARPRPVAPEAPVAAAPSGGGDELTALLRPLVEALSRDTQDRGPAPEAAPANGVSTTAGLSTTTGPTNHRVTDPAER